MPTPKKPMLESEMPKMPPPKPPVMLKSGEKCVCGSPTFGKQILWTLLGVLLVYVTFYVGVLTRNTIRKYDYIGYADQMERAITVTGYGKVTANNDIAVTSISYSNTDMDVAKAQAANKKVMDGVFSELTKLGIAEKDLQSNYTIYPRYTYTEEKGQQLVGYEVRNSVEVKIRDLSKITTILGLAGKYGATEVGGLSFTIDEPEVLKNQARLKAVADAETKAVELSRSLGVRLVAVMNYNEYEANSGGPYPMMRAAVGGMDAAAYAPEKVASGSQDVAMNVSITYKILP